MQREWPFTCIVLAAVMAICISIIVAVHHIWVYKYDISHEKFPAHVEELVRLKEELTHLKTNLKEKLADHDKSLNDLKEKVNGMNLELTLLGNDEYHHHNLHSIIISVLTFIVLIVLLSCCSRSRPGRAIIVRAIM